MKKLIALSLLIALSGCSNESENGWVGVKNYPLIQTTDHFNSRDVNAQFLLNQYKEVAFRLEFTDACEKSDNGAEEITPLVVNGVYVKVFGMCNGTSYLTFPQTAAGNDFMRKEFTDKSSVVIGKLKFSTKNFASMYNALTDYKDKAAEAI